MPLNAPGKQAQRIGPTLTRKEIAATHINAFHHSQKQHISRWQGLEFPDIWLLFAWLALMAIGMIMVTSASMSEAVGHNSDMCDYPTRQATSELLVARGGHAVAEVGGVEVGVVVVRL